MTNNDIPLLKNFETHHNHNSINNNININSGDNFDELEKKKKRNGNPVKRKERRKKNATKLRNQREKKRKEEKKKKKKKRRRIERGMSQTCESQKKKSWLERAKSLTVGPICNFNYKNAIENRVMENENS